MLPKDSAKQEFYFDDPRLRMTVAGRFVVRVVDYIAVLLFLAATVTLIISGVPSLRYLGVFFALIIADMYLHRHEGDMPISDVPKNGKVNLAALMSAASFGVVERAFDKCLINGEDFFLTLAERLLEFPQITNGLARLDIKPKEFKSKLEEIIAATPRVPMTSVFVTKQVEALADQAFLAALGTGHDFIELTNLFSALANVDDEPTKRLFNTFSINAGDLEKALIFSARGVRRAGSVTSILGGVVLETHRRIRHRIMNRAWTSRPTPTLDRYATDFTDLARDAQAGFLIGHEKEFSQLVETLARPMNPNALLVGDAGIGKEAIVKHLAFTLVKDDVPKALFDKRLVSLELQGLVAGAAPDELNKRVKEIVEEIYVAGNIILYIPDIHNLVKTSGTAYISAADALMPVIMNNAFPIVGATYPKEFKQYIEPRSDFVGAFEMIPVSEVSEDEAERILTYEGLILERQYKIIVTFGAVKRAVYLAKKYLHTKFLPASAEELLKSAIVDAERRGEKKLGPERVTAIAEAKVNVPMHEADAKETEKLLHLEDTIHERLVDQEEAVGAVSEALREYRSGLSRKGGPIASFLFVGPTGVGKTETAKILAGVQFGSEKMMIRFDMTEYQDKAGVGRFIGTPDGSMRGALTDAVIAKPYSLILLDEFEKAHPDILNLFLQVLDDGRLTDNMQRTVDFTNTIVIATSNAHSDIINESLSKGEEVSAIAEYLKKRLVDVFKPELLNRFSKIIIFKNLKSEEFSKVVLINLNELAEVVKAQGIFLSFDDEAVKEIARLGYDPAFGARPLRRVIDEKVRAPLSNAILQKSVGKGDRVNLVLKDGKFDLIKN